MNGHSKWRIPTLSTANNQKFYASNGSTELTADNVIEYRITSAPTVDASATVWQRWLNHKLSSTFGGDGATTMDLSATHSVYFSSRAECLLCWVRCTEAELMEMPNKNVLTSLTLKLASGNFGAASARIGYTGAGAVTGLYADIAITVHRNGAQNGYYSYHATCDD
jgi:hypothetical protein